MTHVFPVVLIHDEPGYLVYVPELEINTEGKDIGEAIEMARDAISIWGIAEIDAGREIPQIKNIKAPHNEEDILTLVDVDFDEYRRKVDNRAVRKNVTIPNWLNIEAEKAGINFSKVLQEALIEKVNANS